MICKNCRSDESATDTAQGVVYCTACGMVQEESIIVSSINFTDNGTKSTLDGKIVNMGSKQVGTQYVDASYYIKNTVSNICNTLGLGNQFIDCGFRYYQLLLPYNLSKGKSILYTLSACIYIVCREERTPHLLIDFSNALNIDVFKIGKSFSKIVEVLNLKMPNTDPTMYIQRYVYKLNLKNPKIPEMALRIISRMSRDWITTGRRPNNLCGASILIASRVYGEERTCFEVAKVVHVSIATLKKRLFEISETSSATLDIQQLNAEWYTKEEDPPVLKNRAKNKMKELKKQNTYEKQCVHESYKENMHFCNTNNCNDYVFYEDAGHIDNSHHFDKNSHVAQYETTEDANEDCYDSDNEILTETETNERRQVWEYMYNDYMKERAEKLKHMSKPKRRHIRKQYNSVSDVLKNMNKRISSKINYSIIENIFEDF